MTENVARSRPEPAAVKRLRALGFAVERLADGRLHIAGHGWTVTTRNAWRVLREVAAE